MTKVSRGLKTLSLAAVALLAISFASTSEAAYPHGGYSGCNSSYYGSYSRGYGGYRSYGGSYNNFYNSGHCHW